VVLVVEKGDAAGALGLFQILSVLQLILLCCTVCLLGENGSELLLIPSKVAENCNKILLTVKQKLKLIEKLENKSIGDRIGQGL
jgi:hypothetical protein